MGQQIQISLTHADEEALICFLKAKFPVEVVDAQYPLHWDRKTPRKSADASDWLVVDTRTTGIILKSAFELYDETGNWRTHGYGQPGYDPGKRIGWRIVSQAYSCVEWTREFSDRPLEGRLYLNTQPHPIWAEVSARTGDDIQRMYRAACRWIRQNCVNCSTIKRGLWASKERVKSVRNAQSQALAAAKRRKKDPRDKRFYQLHGKKPSKLTTAEIALYISYCNKMIKYVGVDAAEYGWPQLKEQLQERKKQLKVAAHRSTVRRH